MVTSFQKKGKMLSCLFVLAVALAWTGCSALGIGNRKESVLPKANTTKLKQEVSADPFPSAAQTGVAFATDR